MTETQQLQQGEIFSTQAIIDELTFPDSDFAPEELQYFAAKTDARGSRAARGLAKQLLRSWLLRKTGCEPAAAELVIISNGKPPRLIYPGLGENTAIKISLAHSPSHAACALLVEERP